MKKIKLLSVLFLTVITCLALLSSCTDDGGGDTVIPGGGNETENLIYNQKSELYLVYDPEVVSEQRVNYIKEAFFANEVYIRDGDVSGEAKEHEIVIGDVGREVSDSAYSQLERIETSSEVDVRYCIYSNGSSVAVAFDDDREESCIAEAVEALIKNYAREELVLQAGTYNKTVFNRYDYLGQKDAEKYEEQWKAVSDKYGAAVTDALKSFYSIYDGEALVSWLANLYDPSICVCMGLYGEAECSGTPLCGTGGFYFSNSARDNVGYLPDVESTLQALGLFAALGMDSSYVRLLPKEMGADIAEFTYQLQDEDGFFYHPQWGKNITTSRRGRDLNWSKNILSAYGRTPKYTLADSSAVAASNVTFMLGQSKVSAVSKVIAADSTLVPDHLKTLDDFKDYLENELDFYNAAYPAGNTLGSQISQIRARGEEYVDLMFEHLNKTQNANGTWHPTAGYYAVNGLMKISGIYKDFGRVIPRAEAACLACFDAIMSEDDPGAIVDVWNAWVAITYVFENVRLFAEGGAEKEAELKATLVANSTDAIIATRDKTALFKRLDGSFSYYQSGSCLTSQGAPVSLPGSCEGDVNGCMIATTQMINFVFSGLGMSAYEVDLCGEREKAMLLDILENLSPVNKTDDGNTEGDPLDFDYDDVGDTPSDITLSFSNPELGSFAHVAEDMRDGSDGNVLAYTSVTGSYDGISFENQGIQAAASSFVFESEMCIEQASESTDFLRIEMGKSNDISGVYRISFRKSGGRIQLCDNSSSDSNNCMINYLGASVAEGEWFKLRIEYYPCEGTEESVRAKVYFNDKLLSVSDNYYDYYGKKFIGEGKPNTEATLTRLQFLTGVSSTLLLDNVHACYSKDGYKADELHSDYALSPYALNVDKVYSDADLYGFEDLALGENYPDGFTVNKYEGEAQIITQGSGKALSLSGGAEARIPAKRTASFANCVTVSMDLYVDESLSGDIFKLELLQHGKKNGRINCFVFRTQTADGVKVLNVFEEDSGKQISGVNIQAGALASIKLEYYYRDKVALFYLDGEIVGMISEFTAHSLRQVFDEMLITGTENVTVDNIKVEHGNKDYTKTMEPKYDSFTHDFTDGPGNIITEGGVSVATQAGNSYLSVIPSQTASSIVKIPFNKRDDVMNVSIAKLDMSFTNITKTGTHIISLADSEGNKAVSFAISQKDGVAYLYENTALGTHAVSMGEFVAREGAELEIEYYEALGACRLLIDGELVISGALLYGADSTSVTVEYLTVESSSSAAGIMLDNIVFDRMRKVYIKQSIEDKEADSEEITFGQGSGNDYSEKITSVLNSFAPLPKVDEAIKDAKPDKVLRFDTVSGGGDELRVAPTVKPAGALSWSFNAEIMFTSSESIPFQIYVCNKEGSIVTIYYFAVSGGDVYFYHQDNNEEKPTKTERIKIGRINEWIDFGFEYYGIIDGGDAPKIKTYIGGEYVFEYGAQYPRSDMSSVGRVTFYGLSGGSGTMFIDNVSLKGSTKTYEAE